MPNDSVDTLAAVRRYVMPNRRYGKLQGWALKNADERVRSEFGRALSEDSAHAAYSDFIPLLKADWRARLTATWMISMARRTEFRPLLCTLLEEEGSREAANGYCLALSIFGSQDDAEILAAYLDRSLVAGEPHFAQAWAFGSLLCLDSDLGTSYSNRFDRPDGPWAEWSGSSQAPNERELIDYLRGFVRLHSRKLTASFKVANPADLAYAYEVWRPTSLPENWRIMEIESERKSFDEQLRSTLSEGNPLLPLHPLSVAACQHCGAVIYSLGPGPIRWLVANPGGGPSGQNEVFPDRQKLQEYLMSHA
ncbi:DUF6000 family protein [Streptomyces aureoversilis]|uniref:DUF6000 family protein n=1 Tax=Streptomyces aureoversilis TaxID=67277 RepID=A0ABV9ZYD3_9ACTN